MPGQGVGYDAINQNENSEITATMSDSFTSLGGSRRRRRSSPKPLLGLRGDATWISCVVNLLNTIVGAGVLAMPGAMSKFGMTLGIFVILFCACTSGFGLYLQTRCARYVERGNASFFSLSQLTYPNASVVFDGAIAIKCFGVGVSYLIIIGNLMPLVMLGFNEDAADTPFLVDRHFWVTAFMLIVIPISFLRRLDSLKYTSFIALVSIGYLVIIVVGHYLKGDTLEDRGEINYVQWAGLIPALSSFPIMVFAYTCHQNMFSILNEIRNNSQKSTTRVIGGSIGTAAFIYVLVAVTGYLSYGDNVNGNIISMYPASVASTIGRAAIVILVMFSYPLQIHPCRASIDNILKWRPAKKTMMPLVAPALKPTRDVAMSDTRFALITSLVLILSYIVAMSVSSLERVLAYVGSTGSTSISFILPGIFYWKISDPALDNIIYKVDEDNNEDDFFQRADTWQSRWLRRMSLALVAWGFLVMGVCLALNIFFIPAE